LNFNSEIIFTYTKGNLGELLKKAKKIKKQFGGLKNNTYLCIK